MGTTRREEVVDDADGLGVPLLVSAVTVLVVVAITVTVEPES